MSRAQRLARSLAGPAFNTHMCSDSGQCGCEKQTVLDVSLEKQFLGPINDAV